MFFEDPVVLGRIPLLFGGYSCFWEDIVFYLRIPVLF